MSVESVTTGFTGAERAAILLMSLGERHAAEVIKFMTPAEVQKLGKSMTAIDKVDKQAVTTILGECCLAANEQTELGMADRDYLRSLLVTAFGEDEAGIMLDRVQPGGQLKGLEALKWMEARTLADILGQEHPQIIAVVLSFLEQDQAAEVLAALPENLRVDIVMRIASLDGVRPGALALLNDSLEKQFSNHSHDLKSYTMGGLRNAAGMMNYLDARLEAEIIAKIRAIDDELGLGIQDLKFEFGHLIELDDRSIQTLLREISSETLRVALRGAEEAIKEKIFSNMSRRASEMLRDDLEARGPVRLSEVKTAQREILTVVWYMVETGEISLDGRGDEYV